MEAILLAAGRSTRTYPLTVDKPKPLLKVANKTLIEHNLEQLRGLVDEAVIIVGFNHELIENIGKSYGKIKLSYVMQKEQNGTGGALMAAKNFVKGRFLVMNGDDLYSRKDIKNCIDAGICVLAKKVDDLARFGEVKSDGIYAAAIAEKESKGNGLAYTGLMVLDESCFSEKFKPSPRGELEITDIVGKGDKKRIVISQDYWIPISYPWNLLEANEYFLNKITKEISGEVEEGATLKGLIRIGKGTLVRAGAYIEGPVVIGENCNIGPNCFIRPHTSIGNNCKIGNAVEIKNSIIGDNSAVGHLSYVGDSVLGINVNIAAGTITANLRHDNKTVASLVKDNLVDSGRRKLGAIIGDGAHTGIHTSIYPGRKIWPGMSTLPGEIVKKDVMPD